MQPPQHGFVHWYEGCLSSRPVITKAITGSFLWGLGDFVAQVVAFFFTRDGVDDFTTGALVNQEFAYDFLRMAKAVFFGFAIHAPLSHVHYNFLEWMTAKTGLQGLTITVFKTVMEQFVYWSWFSNCLYHGAMGVMNGMNMTQIFDRIAEVLMPTQYAQWSFWIPVQLLNFRFVPVRHQLNVVLLTSVVWTAILSAWYPPEMPSMSRSPSSSSPPSLSLTTQPSMPPSLSSSPMFSFAEITMFTIPFITAPSSMPSISRSPASSSSPSTIPSFSLAPSLLSFASSTSPSPNSPTSSYYHSGHGKSGKSTKSGKAELF